MKKASIWTGLVLLAAVAGCDRLAAPPSNGAKPDFDRPGGTSWTLEIDVSQGVEGGVEAARSRTIDVVRRRVEEMGVAADVRPDGETRIAVRFPDLKPEARARALEIIRRPAYLEFRMVHPKNDELIRNLFAEGKVPAGFEIESLPGPGGDRWIRQGEPPTELELAALRRFEEKGGFDLLLERDAAGQPDRFRPYYVSRRADMTGEHIQSARAESERSGPATVRISFDDKGRRIFAKLTADHAPGGAKTAGPNDRRCLAIVLDGALYSAPLIRAEISGGEAVIGGNLTMDEARDLALVLRAGALPAPLRAVEERTEDPNGKRGL